MKKISIIILTFVLILSLASCLRDPFEKPPEKPIKKPKITKKIEQPTKETTPVNTEEPTEVPTNTPNPTNTPTPEPAPTPAPTPTPIPPTNILASDTNIYDFGGGQGTITIDLNGDGTDDVITYSFLGISGPVPSGAINLSTPFLNMMDYDMYQCNISINGQPIIIQGEVMSGLILIGDIDNTDSQYEIMIPEFGPSGDPQTTFIAYNGVSPINIGKIYQNPLMNLKVDGNKIITGQKRGAKLHTWFYDARYRIAPNGLIREIKKDGLVMMNTSITALVDLPLQISPTDSTPAFTLTTGENAIITWTDDESWFCIETSSGLVGWFELIDFFTINGMPATDVFSGLTIAD